jgi:hypothetical protein
MGEGSNYRLHPLIHTIAPETSAQDVEKKKAEQKTPHFLSVNQDIVAWFQEKKCELRDVIQIPPQPLHAAPPISHARHKLCILQWLLLK